MAGSGKKPSGSWVDGVASIIDSVTNLYNAVAAKSPRVADTVVILAIFFPFYLVFMMTLGQRRKEKIADAKVKAVRKSTTKPRKKADHEEKP